MLQLYLYSREKQDEVIADLTGKFRGLKFSTSLHGGFNALEFRPLLGEPTAFLWAERYHLHRLVLWDSQFGLVWEGRIEDVYPLDVGMKVRAVGFWASLFDQVYNARYWHTTWTARDIIIDVLSNACPDIATDYSGLQDPGLDIHPQTFEDNFRPGQIVQTVVSYGDTEDPPRAWYFAIWEDRKPYLFPRKEQVDWCMSLADLASGGIRFCRSSSNLWNRVAAIYSSEVGAREMTDWVQDDDSIAQYGRRDYILSLAGVTEDVAEKARDVALEIYKQPSQSATARFRGYAWDRNGVRKPLYLIRAGDVLRIKDLVPSEAMLDSELADSLRTFFLVETEYNDDTGELRVSPDFASPLLDILVARESLE